MVVQVNALLRRCAYTVRDFESERIGTPPLTAPFKLHTPIAPLRICNLLTTYVVLLCGSPKRWLRVRDPPRHSVDLHAATATTNPARSPPASCIALMLCIESISNSFPIRCHNPFACPPPDRSIDLTARLFRATRYQFCVSCCVCSTQFPVVWED